MFKLIKNLIKDKKEYKSQILKIEKMPEDYRFVFLKIQKYIWSFAGGNGRDMLKLQNQLIDLFEESALEGKNVLEVTGEDIVGFCDEFLCDVKKWTDRYRNKLNRDINNKLSK
ncbi:MAG: DUF1048 domain-containing protein [Oscillospiraceae bacterium]